MLHCTALCTALACAYHHDVINQCPATLATTCGQWVAVCGTRTWFCLCSVCELHMADKWLIHVHIVCFDFIRNNFRELWSIVRQICPSLNNYWHLFLLNVIVFTSYLLFWSAINHVSVNWCLTDNIFSCLWIISSGEVSTKLKENSRSFSFRRCIVWTESVS